MNYTNILSLLCGLSLFLFGMHTMSDALESAAGSKLKNVLERFTSSRTRGVLTGAGVTAIIQSSSATTVMVVGFVSAGLMTLTQSVGVIMGANIGTTVTSLLLSVKLDIGAIFAILGMLIIFIAKRNTLKQTGYVLMGLGVLFVGMNTMSDAMAPIKDSPVILSLAQGMKSPPLALLFGLVLTALIQSSSASVGILQVLIGQGIFGLPTALYMLCGQNIGTCVTALLAATSAEPDAKRAAAVHLIFNIAGTVFFILLINLVPFSSWMVLLSPNNAKLQVAFAHISFNVVATMVLLPFSSLIERVAIAVVPKPKEKPTARTMRFFDERLLTTPAIALHQLYKECARMGELAVANAQSGITTLLTGNLALREQIESTEETVDYLNETITAYLIQIKGLSLTESDNKTAGMLFHAVNDIERISDHAMNFLEAAIKCDADGIRFSDKGKEELRDMGERVSRMLREAVRLFMVYPAPSEAYIPIRSDEEEIDRLTDQLQTSHIVRLKEKKCSAKSAFVFLNTLINLERVADHANNIAQMACGLEREHTN